MLAVKISPRRNPSRSRSSRPTCQRRSSEADLDALIAHAIATTGAQSVRDMGKVMALIKDQAQGRADMAVVSARVKAHFGG